MSKKSTKKNVNTTIQKSGDFINEKSNLKNNGSIDGGIDTISLGISTIPSPIPAPVTAKIPIKSELLILSAVKTAMIKIPNSANNAGTDGIFANTSFKNDTLKLGASGVPKLIEPIFKLPN